MEVGGHFYLKAGRSFPGTLSYFAWLRREKPELEEQFLLYFCNWLKFSIMTNGGRQVVIQKLGMFSYLFQALVSHTPCP